MASSSSSRKKKASGTANAFADTMIVSPTRIHKATILWLHDIGENGRDSATFVRKLNLPNVKWICPTAPTRPVTSLGGFQTTAWCDVMGISENMADDMVSLNSTAGFVVNLLKDEPGNVMIGLGGIGMGAAVALYFATSYITRWEQTIRRLRTIVGINGWLPAWRNFRRNPSLAPSLQISLTHGTSDAIVPFQIGNRCCDTLRRAGFPVTFTPYEGDHHANIPQVINGVRMWLTMNLHL
ncbi:acyl-protein thioesterase 2 [Capsella rubella]|uniref:acyl-protein thioesterase 2 n=1 Tax=Capsella rubella TaxID=81985 RepID=UPI000CD4FC15|nr:acyl-protein thioesterase 2 [Capsella rubella]